MSKGYRSRIYTETTSRSLRSRHAEHTQFSKHITSYTVYLDLDLNLILKPVEHQMI